MRFSDLCEKEVVNVKDMAEPQKKSLAMRCSS